MTASEGPRALLTLLAIISLAVTAPASAQEPAAAPAPSLFVSLTHEDGTVIRSGDEVFASAALDAVRAGRFEAGVDDDGRAVASAMVVVLHFRLDE